MAMRSAFLYDYFCPKNPGGKTIKKHMFAGRHNYQQLLQRSNAKAIWWYLMRLIWNIAPFPQLSLAWNADVSSTEDF